MNTWIGWKGKNVYRTFIEKTFEEFEGLLGRLRTL
jgi:hypothetical protein